jgi:hypothetical protein
MKTNIQRRPTIAISPKGSLFPQSREPAPKAKNVELSTAMASETLPSKHQTNPILTHLSQIPQGLTGVYCPDASIAGEVRNTITQMALRGASTLGLPMPKVAAVKSVFSGNSRRVEQAKLLANANQPSKATVHHDVQVMDSRNGFDWCSNEGMTTLLPLIQSATNMWLILEQQVAGPMSPILANGLSRISAAAKQSGAWVMMIVVSGSGCQSDQLQQLCDEYIEVSTCEPDSGTYAAFAFDCVNIRDLAAFGAVKTMCSVFLSDGHIRRRFEPFVSHDLLNRAIWALRCQQKTVEEIGKLTGLDKSNVSRRLANLPQPCSDKTRFDWLTDYLQSTKGNHDAAMEGKAR